MQVSIRLKSLTVLFSIAIMFCSFSSIAQTGTITGTITEADSSKTVSKVSVFLEGTELGTSSKGNGSYRITDVPAGKYTLVVSCVGYYTAKMDLTINASETLVKNFSLIEAISTLSEVTVMVGKADDRLNATPGSYTYISPKEIQKFGHSDINRSLRSAPGINIQEEDGFGLRPNIGLRGTGVERSSKITLMEDGILIAPAPYSAPSAYYFPTFGRMSAVEVLKGSSQIKYGPYTTGGAINLLSTPIPNSFSGKLNMKAGSFASRNIHASVGGKHKQISYLFESYQYGSEGFKVLDGLNTGFDKEDYLMKVRFNSNQGAKYIQHVGIRISQSSELSNETYLGLTEADFNDNPYQRYAASAVDLMRAKQNTFSANHHIRFNGNLELNTTVYRTQFSRNWYKLDKVQDSSGTKHGIAGILDDPSANEETYKILNGEADANGSALHVKANNRVYLSNGIQSVLSIDKVSGAFIHKMDIGLRYHYDQMDRFQWVDGYSMQNGEMILHEKGEPGTESNRIESALAVAGFMQYSLKYKNWTFRPGIRYENIDKQRVDYGKTSPERDPDSASTRSNTTAVFIPGLGANYSLSPYVNIFAGIHKGFAPAGNTPGANPEESINYELGVRFRKPMYSGELVFFMNNYKNLLGSDLASSGGSGNGSLFNAGRVLSQGIELSLSTDPVKPLHWPLNLPISLNYTYTDATFLNSFNSDFEGWGTVTELDDFPYLAKHTFNLSAGIELSKFAIYYNLRFNGEMRTAPGSGEILAQELIPSHTIMDISAAYQLNPRFAVNAAVNNVANVSYLVSRRPAGLRPGLPRFFSLGVQANF